MATATPTPPTDTALRRPLLKRGQDGHVDCRRPARTSASTRIDWLDSWHSFSFSDHYGAKNTHHGLLRVLNDDLMRGRRPARTAPHMEIVTWVLEGAPSTATVGQPGRDHARRRQGAGGGAASALRGRARPHRVSPIADVDPPDTTGIPPGYEWRDISADSTTTSCSRSRRERSGGHHVAPTTRRSGSRRSAAPVAVPGTPFVHVMVSTGATITWRRRTRRRRRGPPHSPERPTSPRPPMPPRSRSGRCGGA
jgi:hypothetical protein